MDFSKTDLTVVAYLRMVDIKSMKVLTSGMIHVGERVSLPAEKEMKAFNDAYDIVKGVNFSGKFYRQDIGYRGLKYLEKGV